MKDALLRNRRSSFFSGVLFVRPMHFFCAFLPIKASNAATSEQSLVFVYQSELQSVLLLPTFQMGLGQENLIMKKLCRSFSNTQGSQWITAYPH